MKRGHRPRLQFAKTKGVKLGAKAMGVFENDPFGSFSRLGF